MALDQLNSAAGAVQSTEAKLPCRLSEATAPGTLTYFNTQRRLTSMDLDLDGLLD
jgi:hypothetical protein